MQNKHIAPLKSLTITDCIKSHANRFPERAACIFQPLGPDSVQTLTYAELTTSVEQRASLLTEKGLRGKRAALLYPTGLDFVINFLACLASGTIAVPINLSNNHKYLMRTQAILADAQISALLTTDDTINKLGDGFFSAGIFTPSVVILTESSQAQYASRLSASAAVDTAFVQYTSGSTSTPKGVIVSHENIMANQEAIKSACGHTEGTIIGGWLPQFHDMGLIGHMLHPLYLGGTYVFMPPLSFIQKPVRWLQLIDQYNIHSSAAPNFGYQYCVQKIREHDVNGKLDLSSWKVALNGSEPVHASSVEQFIEKFAPVGFDPNAVFPCYGMAETTLFVSGGPARTGLQYVHADRSAFEEGRFEENTSPHAEHTIPIVNCGECSAQFTVAIVDPETQNRCPPGQIGEVWLSGPSVSRGYLNNEAATEETFHAQISGESGVQYLRTGDLGYLDGKELFITGRIKELIIIRGKNLYPYDIEKTCNEYEYAAGNNGASLFSVQDDEEGQVACVVEIKKAAFNNQCHEQMKQQIRALVGNEHGLTLDHLKLVPPGSIPKTSSGKVKRTQCYQLLEESMSKRPTAN